MDAAEILVDVSADIATVTFNRPEVRNAITYAMWRQIPNIVSDLEKDSRVRVVVIRGAGEKAFIAGADISQFEEVRSDMERAKVYNEATMAAMRSLWNCEKPLLAMIHGYCMGGGCAVAVACDVRIAAAGARFGIPAAKLGLAYSQGAARFLVSVVGPAHAKEMLFTGRVFDASEAKSMGLLNMVVPEDALERTTYDIAKTIAANAPLSVQACKLVINSCLLDPEQRDMGEIEAAIRRCFDSRDYKEGVRAFMEKRAPRFEGR